MDPLRIPSTRSLPPVATGSSYSSPPVIHLRGDRRILAACRAWQHRFLTDRPSRTPKRSKGAMNAVARHLEWPLHQNARRPGATHGRMGKMSSRARERIRQIALVWLGWTAAGLFYITQDSVPRLYRGEYVP